jgi:hypothetical protein
MRQFRSIRIGCCVLDATVDQLSHCALVEKIAIGAVTNLSFLTGKAPSRWPWGKYSAKVQARNGHYGRI